MRYFSSLIFITICVGIAGVFGYKSNLLPLFPVFPIKTVQVIAPLRYVTEKDVEDLLIKANIAQTDFFYINMLKLKKQLKQNQWIDDINIARVWPDKIRINFAEQEPLAFWNKSVITKGSCEIASVPDAVSGMSLPVLVGNEKNTEKLCDTLEKLQSSIKPLDMEIKKLAMSQRGSWYLELNNDLIVLLGRKDIINRIQKFVSFFADYSSELNKTELNTKNIIYIDMRYNNGLAVGTGIKQNLIELMETA